MRPEVEGSGKFLQIGSYLLNLRFRIGRDIEIESLKLWVEKCKNPLIREGENPLKTVLCAEVKLKRLDKQT